MGKSGLAKPLQSRQGDCWCCARSVQPCLASAQKARMYKHCFMLQGRKPKADEECTASSGIPLLDSLGVESAQLRSHKTICSYCQERFSKMVVSGSGPPRRLTSMASAMIAAVPGSLLSTENLAEELKGHPGRGIRASAEVCLRHPEATAGMLSPKQNTPSASFCNIQHNS